MTTFNGLAYFALGALNGTVLISTPSFKLCEAAGRDSYNQGYNAVNNTINNGTSTAFFESLDSLI